MEKYLPNGRQKMRRDTKKWAPLPRDARHHYEFNKTIYKFKFLSNGS